MEKKNSQLNQTFIANAVLGNVNYRVIIFLSNPIKQVSHARWMNLKKARRRNRIVRQFN